MYRFDGVTVGFGEATFEMRRLLREAGLQLSNENNQYEDHMGIELLYLSVISGRVSEAIESEGSAGSLIGELGLFVKERPLSWIQMLSERVEEVFPEGYYLRLLRLVEAIVGFGAMR